MAGHVVANLLLGVPLWVTGTVAFDAVHCALHRMLRSRWRALRTLAWPHTVHHRWLDAALRIHPEEQRRNVFCHLVPEFATQLAFSALLFGVLPPGPVLACVGLQTLAFGYVISRQGLDVNHRPVSILDAYRPLPVCPPAYHALHHVYPDAYFSAYTRLVDHLVGGGAMLAGRRHALAGADTPFGRALAAELERAGAASVARAETPADAARADLDVLVVCSAALPADAFVERFIAATRTRQLPPEVWAVHARGDDPRARYYLREPRVSYRLILLPDGRADDPAGARDAARRACFWIRHGLHVVPTRLEPALLREGLRFLRTPARRPEGVPPLRSRRQLAAVAAAGATSPGTEAAPGLSGC